MCARSLRRMPPKKGDKGKGKGKKKEGTRSAACHLAPHARVAGRGLDGSAARRRWARGIGRPGAG